MKRRLMNNVGLKVLAFLSAFVLWLMVVNIDDPVKTETYHNIYSNSRIHILLKQNHQS